MDPLPDDKGTDTNGGKYSSIQDLWVNELGKPGEEGKDVTWYPNASMLLVLFIYLFIIVFKSFIFPNTLFL
jgi:hypothetical protein